MRGFTSRSDYEFSLRARGCVATLDDPNPAAKPCEHSMPCASHWPDAVLSCDLADTACRRPQATRDQNILHAARVLVRALDPDPKRGGLAETPRRVAEAWKEWTSGYDTNPADVLKVFEDGAERCDEMVVVRDVPFYSHCEHHLAPFFGAATIAYVPDGRIVGLSKLSRLTDVFARRLQVQERLTNQIADALVEHLQPRGVAVLVRARHLCMESRGVRKQGHHTVTSALRGVLKTDASARAEFLELAK